MIDYRAVIQRYGIKPQGVIHVGGYLGDEEWHYRDMGFTQRLFIEAQKDTFEKLKKRLEGTGAHCENFAASDRNGVTKFHVAANDQSSSILQLKKHLDIYPHITETQTYDVPTRRIDDLLGCAPYRDSTFNFMNVDVQGAEFLVLLGSVDTLKYMDFLNLEVNFDELYEGAPHIRKLDSFLSNFEFIRADTKLAHASWGDAIYVRNKFTQV